MFAFSRIPTNFGIIASFSSSMKMEVGRRGQGRAIKGVVDEGQ